MPINKVVFGNTTVIDLTDSTLAQANQLVNGVTAYDRSGTKITGTYEGSEWTSGIYMDEEGYIHVSPEAGAGGVIFEDGYLIFSPNAGDGTPTLQTKTVTPTTSQQSVTPDTGYDGLSSVTVEAMPSGSMGTPTATKGSVSNHSVSVTPSVTNTAGYITGGTVNGTAVTVSASELVSGSETKTTNGTYDVTNLSELVVDVPPTTPTLQSKTATPTESQQTITADSGYDGLSSVTVNAVSSTYVGSDITRRSGTDLTASGATVTVPAGYYSAQASKAVASGSAGTPSASKGTVSNHSVTVTPSVTNTTGYITGGTKTGTAVTVSASELVSGSQTISANGTTDVTNLASVTVAIPFVTYYTGTTDPPSSLGSDGDIYLKVVS